MNILIFSSKYPPQVGGVEDVVKNLSFGLNKSNNVLVVTSNNLRQNTPNFFKKFIAGFFLSSFTISNNVPVFRVFMSLPRGVFGFISFPYRFTFSVFLLRKTINNFKPQVINAHFLDDSLLYFYISTLFTRIPIVLDIHGNELHLFSKNMFYRFLFKRVINRSSKIIVHSNFMYKVLNKMYLVKPSIIVIPNSVDLDKFPINKSAKKDKEYYLFVGRLDYKKGIDILIKAYKRVEKKLSRKLVIVGGSTGERRHGSLDIQDLKLLAGDSKIEFTGRVDPSEVMNYFSNAYYCIFPSRFEPFGIVALESLACGTPFIASSGGFKEIAKQTQGGLIFKPGDVKALSSILLRVDGDLANREVMSKKGLTNISKYSLTNFLKKYIQVLNT